MRPILLWIVTLLPLMSPVGALVQDNGDGMYTNPPLYADYPDPDIIRGLRARGGYVVDVAWKDGKLARAVLHSEREPQKDTQRKPPGRKAFKRTRNAMWQRPLIPHEQGCDFSRAIKHLRTSRQHRG